MEECCCFILFLCFVFLGSFREFHFQYQSLGHAQRSVYSHMQRWVLITVADPREHKFKCGLGNTTNTNFATVSFFIFTQVMQIVCGLLHAVGQNKTSLHQPLRCYARFPLPWLLVSGCRAQQKFIFFFALWATCTSVLLAWSYFELAQSSVDSQTSHSNFQPHLPVGQVTNEFCLPNRKIYWALDSGAVFRAQGYNPVLILTLQDGSIVLWDMRKQKPARKLMAGTVCMFFTEITVHAYTALITNLPLWQMATVFPRTTVGALGALVILCACVVNGVLIEGGGIKMWFEL